MYYVDVDDVYIVYVFEGFGDGLIGSEVWEFYKRVDFIEYLNCGDEVLVVDELFFWDRGVDIEVGSY